VSTSVSGIACARAWSTICKGELGEHVCIGQIGLVGRAAHLVRDLFRDLAPGDHGHHGAGAGEPAHADKADPARATRHERGATVEIDGIGCGPALCRLDHAGIAAFMAVGWSGRSDGAARSTATRAGSASP
jgi:hypothetical protein